LSLVVEGNDDELLGKHGQNERVFEPVQKMLSELKLSHFVNMLAGVRKA